MPEYIATDLGKAGITTGGEWSEQTAYPELEIVSHSGGSYMSLKPVPAGTPLTNAEYWMPIAATAETIQAWLDEHPEATTSVQDGSISLAKLERALSSEITQHGNDIAILGARVDEFVHLEDGSTTGDAELADIRVGADGNTYATAGDAVRGLDFGLKKASDGRISAVAQKYGYKKSHNYDWLWTKGRRISAASGNVYADETYICTSGFVDEDFDYIGATSYGYQLFAWDENDVYVGVLKYGTTFSFVTSDHSIDKPLSFSFLRTIFPTYKWRIQKHSTDTESVLMLSERIDSVGAEDSEMYTYTAKSRVALASGVKLSGQGAYTDDADYQVKHFSVTAGSVIYIDVSADCPCTYQFISNANLTASNVVVGVPNYGAFKGFVRVPTGAIRVCISELKTNTTNVVGTATLRTGIPGEAAGFGAMTVDIEMLPAWSEPTAEVESSGPDTAKNFEISLGIPNGILTESVLSDKLSDIAAEYGYRNSHNLDSMWIPGKHYNTETGALETASDSCCTAGFIPDDAEFIGVKAGSGQFYRLLAWDGNGDYVGQFKYSTVYIFTTSSANTLTAGLDLTFLRSVFPGYKFKVNASESNGGSQSVLLLSGREIYVKDDSLTYQKALLYNRQSIRLNGKGMAVQDEYYHTYRYYVRPGEILYIRASKDAECVAMFTNNVAITTGNHCIGTPIFTAIDGFIRVPTGAYYVFVTQSVDNTDYTFGIASSRSRRQYEAEELALLRKVAWNRDSNTLVFAMSTDNHLGVYSGGSYQLHYAEEAAYLTDYIGADFQLNTGDMVDAPTDSDGDPDATVNCRRITDIVSVLSDCHAPFVYAVGHHEMKPSTIIVDGEQQYYFDRKRLTGLTQGKMKWLDDMHMTEDPASSSYYIDFKRQKIRYIILDSTTYTSNGFSQKVRDFLQASLGSVPTSYKVLISSHSPTRENASGFAVTYGAETEEIIEDFVSGGGTVIGYIHGHAHWDNVIMPDESALSYPIICTCCSKVSQASPGADIAGHPTAPERANLTYSAYLIDVYCVHADTGTINIYRFGAGGDRIIHGTPVTVTEETALTTELSGTLTWESDNTAVATVSGGTVSVVGNGSVTIRATDEDGNLELWLLEVEKDGDGE